MYRGVDAPVPPDGVHLLIRADRRPRDTGQTPAFNIAFNLMMELQFGVESVRRKSLFVTGSFSLAQRFARGHAPDCVALVKPQCAYRFIWSPSVRDSKRLAAEYSERYLETFMPWEIDLYPRLGVDIDLTWRDVQSVSDELLHHPKKGFSWNDRPMVERLKANLSQLSGRGQTPAHRYQDTDLGSAVGSGNEILIFDCPEGYRLSPVPPSQWPGEDK